MVEMPKRSDSCDERETPDPSILLITLDIMQRMWVVTNRHDLLELLIQR